MVEKVLPKSLKLPSVSVYGHFSLEVKLQSARIIILAML